MWISIAYLCTKFHVMYIYNITTNVANEIQKEWLAWMHETFIPAMLTTKKFSKAIMTEVQIEEEMGGITYSTQYFTESKEMLVQFEKEDQVALLRKHSKFQGQFVDFSTQLKVINQY